MSSRNSMADVSIAGSTARIIDDTASMEAKSVHCYERFPCFSNIKLFTIISSILACINGSISASYLPAVISTLEQRFHLNSFVSGFVVSSYEVGAVIAVVLVSYIGHNKHIPHILGWGTLIIGLGSVTFSLPHFISPGYSETEVGVISSNSNTSTDFCDLNKITTPATKCLESSTSSDLYVAIFVIAQTLIGVGSSPIMTIAISYIDNSVSKKTSAQYIGKCNANAVCATTLTLITRSNK